MQNSVAFIVAPYGFGPSSKAIAISSFLPNSIERVYFGDGPPLEVAKSSNQFSKCVKIDFLQPGERIATILSAYKVLVFINTMRFVPAMSKIHNSLIFVDTLAWLRKSQPLCLHLVKAYFAQRFFHYNVSSILTLNDNFYLTGAIVPKTINFTISVTKEEKLLSKVKSPIIHCGGLFSPVMCKGADIEFVHQLFEIVKNINEPLRIILPKHLHHFFRNNNNTYLSVIDCSPITVHKHIVGSLFALTTSGIEFSYESIILGVPTLFLPPFNASQHLQLAYYKKTFYESILFQLDNELPQFHSDSLDKDTVAIQKRGMDGIWKNQFESIGNYLQNAVLSDKLIADLKAVRENQKKEMQLVGHGGADDVATYIMREVYK